MNGKDPVNLDSILDGKRLKNRIALIGVELEGGWSIIPPGVEIVHDGSVRNLPAPPANSETPLDVANLAQMVEARVLVMSRGRGYSNAQMRALRAQVEEAIRQEMGAGRAPLRTGEIPSPVMPPSELGVWMKKYYPQVVNHTCGLHVHMSFESALHYQRLMVPTYQATILSYVTKWAKKEGLSSSHPLWARLRGESRYCQHQFWPDHQVQARGKDHNQERHGHRYTVINFCYLTNGTVECRLLPMMDTADQGIRAVQQVLDITNAFLAKGKELRGLKCEVKALDGFSDTSLHTLTPQRRERELRA